LRGEHLLEIILNKFPGKVQENASLDALTTYRVGGPADLIVKLDDEQEIAELLQIIKASDLTFVVLGKGSNVLIMDGGIRGVVLLLSDNFKKISYSEEEGGVLVSVDAAVTIAELMEYCIAYGISGFEFAAGIPGSIGGCVRGNAGTRDGDFAAAVNWIRLINEQGKIQTITRANLEYRYRGLQMPGRFVITTAGLKGQKGSPEIIKNKIEDIIHWRHSRQPYDKPSAGSVFKNPEMAPAAKLIDQAGCKGMRVGGAAISEKHANFIVNEENATASDILKLIEEVRRRVFEKFQVLLETEIHILGEGHAK